MQSEMIALQQIVNHDRNVEFQRKNDEYARFQRGQVWKDAEVEIESQRVASFNIQGNTAWDEVQADFERDHKSEKKTPSAYSKKLQREKKERVMINDYITYKNECDRRYDAYLAIKKPDQVIDWCLILEEVEAEFLKDGIDISKIPAKLRQRAERIREGKES
jgi:hypothetical protein